MANTNEPVNIFKNKLPPIVLHLKTQNGQPYGSTRKCCEECGTMIVGDSLPAGHAWVDTRGDYTDLVALERSTGTKYIRCNEVKS